jgi:DNA polymerase elongation subunit (family B)
MSKKRNLQLIKTINCKDEEPNARNPDKMDRIDVLIKILKDEDTGEKEVEILRRPEITYYVNKEESDLQVNSIPIEDVREVTTTSDNIVKSVAYELGLEDFFWNCIKERKFAQSRAVFLDPNVHGSDVNLEDYYIGKHYEEYPIEGLKNQLTKAFFDIEVDSIDIVGFPEADKAECPVNAISFFNDSNMTLYELLLNDPDNLSQIKFKKKDNLKKFKNRIKEKYKDMIGLDIKVKIVFYDDEIELISDFFSLVHILKPDYCMAWNLTNFDIPYLITRLAVLGESPEDIICDPDVGGYYWYCLDIDNKTSDPTEKSSSFQCVDFTNWQDALLLYANLRKQFGKKESYKLDDIALEEVGVPKVHFKNPRTTIKTSCYDDYEEFTEYSMHDSMLLFMLEHKNKDCDMIQMVSAKTETRVIKALKKTVCIKNLARRFYYNKGYIMSNNHNAVYGGINEHSGQDFRGAFVADPNLNKSLGKLINGILSKFVFENVVDFDLSSLYPSIILAFNVDATTQIGLVKFRTICIDKETNESYYEDELDFGDMNEAEKKQELQNYTIVENKFSADELFDDLVSQDYINIANKYYDLPNVQEMLDIIDNVA